MNGLFNRKSHCNKPLIGCLSHRCILCVLNIFKIIITRYFVLKIPITCIFKLGDNIFDLIPNF